MWMDRGQGTSQMSMLIWLLWWTLNKHLVTKKVLASKTKCKDVAEMKSGGVAETRCHGPSGGEEVGVL